LKGARPVWAGGHWKRSREISHLASGLPVLNASADEHGQPLYRDGQILLLWVRLRAEGGDFLAEVWDQAPGAPVLKTVGPDAESGRGLAMVRDLSDAWGWYPAERQPGKCVWAKISIAS
jgi:hypothetical protein